MKTLPEYEKLCAELESENAILRAEIVNNLAELTIHREADVELKAILQRLKTPPEEPPARERHFTCAKCGKILKEGRWLGTLHLCS